MSEENKPRSTAQKIIYGTIAVICVGMGIYCLIQALDAFGIL